MTHDFFARLRLEIWAFLGAMLMHLLYRTWRWEGAGLLQSGKRIDFTRPAIMIFWHNRQLMMPGLHGRYFVNPKENPVYTLMSEHSDGRLIARIMDYFNLKSVAGSSTRGGKKALVRLIRLTRQGQFTAITPDGPKGPKYELKAGVITLQQATGAWIYPMTCGASSYWSFGSWDAMILPKPFSRIVATVGSPIKLEADIPSEGVEEARFRIQRALIELNDQADSHFMPPAQSAESSRAAL